MRRHRIRSAFRFDIDRVGAVDAGIGTDRAGDRRRHARIDVHDDGSPDADLCQYEVVVTFVPFALAALSISVHPDGAPLTVLPSAVAIAATNTSPAVVPDGAFTVTVVPDGVVADDDAGIHRPRTSARGAEGDGVVGGVGGEGAGGGGVPS